MTRLLTVRWLHIQSKQLRQIPHKLPLTASQWFFLPINFCKLLIQLVNCLCYEFYSSLKMCSIKVWGVPDCYCDKQIYKAKCTLFGPSFCRLLSQQTVAKAICSV